MRPKPQDVIVRRTDGSEEIVTAEEFAERRREAQWASWREAYFASRPAAVEPEPDPDWHSESELDFVHSRLALREGDVVTVIGDSLDGLEWFVQDVNGAEQSITACTLIVDTPCVDTFDFAEVRILYVADDPQHQHEAAATYARIKSRLGKGE